MTAPAFSFYAKDWLAATLTWSLEARGAYMTLLAYQWDAGAVPSGMAALARLLAVSEPRARKLWAIIGDKFTCGADLQWRNPRLELERQKQADRRAALHHNGTKGGRPTKPNPNQTPNQTETNRFHVPKPNGNQTGTKRFHPQKPNGNQNESLASSSSIALEESPPTPPPAGGLRPRREDRERATAILRSRQGYCQHEPLCANEVACCERIAIEIRQKGVT